MSKKEWNQEDVIDRACKAFYRRFKQYASYETISFFEEYGKDYVIVSNINHIAVYRIRNNGSLKFMKSMYSENYP